MRSANPTEPSARVPKSNLRAGWPFMITRSRDRVPYAVPKGQFDPLDFGGSFAGW